MSASERCPFQQKKGHAPPLDPPTQQHGSAKDPVWPGDVTVTSRQMSRCFGQTHWHDVGGGGQRVVSKVEQRLIIDRRARKSLSAGAWMSEGEGSSPAAGARRRIFLLTSRRQEDGEQERSHAVYPG